MNADRHFQRISCALLLAVATLACGIGNARASRVYLDFSSPDFRPVPMAVPFFQESGTTEDTVQKGKQFSQLLADGLGFHGFVKIIAADQYGGGQEYDWKSVGADFVILASYTMEPQFITFEFRLLNVLEEKMVLGRKYSGKHAQAEEMVLAFCDEIIRQLTGTPGISRTKIAFVSTEGGGKDIYLADVLGKKVRRITRHHYLAVSPRFSPDGRSLAYTSYHRTRQILYVTDLGQSQFARTVSQRPGLNLAPAWHKDGRTMAITLSYQGNPDLYLMDTKGKILKRLTENVGANVSASWAPDGNRLAFVSDRSGRPHIYVMDTVKNTIQRLTFAGGDNTSPSWSPVDDTIVFAALAGGEYQLFTVPATGGAPSRITSSWGDHESPSWAPDGRQIVFALKRKNRQQLAAIFKNGAGERVLFDRKGEQSFPQWSPRISQ